MSQPKARLRPRPKVAAAGAGGGAVTLIILIAAQLGLDLPPEVASAIVAIISFGAGYFKSEA